MADKGKVLVVGLDGATFDLVRPWAEQGELPTFARLLRDGFSHDLTVELPPITVPNWPTFATGKNPGKHGLLHFMRREAGSTRLSIVSSGDLRGQTIWDILSERGRRSIVINAPVTFPPSEINGLLITGLLTPRSAQEYTYPAELKAEIQELGYMLTEDVACVKGNEKKYLEALFRVADARLRTALVLMQEHAWDFFFIVFDCTDHAGHYFWKFIDPHHPEHAPDAPAELKTAILRIYRRMDEALASFLSAIDEDTTLVVMSDHGMGPLHQRSNINNWLLDAGFLAIQETPRARFKHWLFRHGFTPQAVHKATPQIGLAQIRKRVDPRQQGSKALYRRLFLSFDDIDWARTRAYALGGMGQIYINLKGREPMGIVEPGQEYQALREELAEGLYRIVNPLSGQRYIEKVYWKEELYSGERLDWLPDIIFEPGDLSCSDAGVFEFFSNQLFHPARAISGDHRKNGLFMMWGPHVVGNAGLPSGVVKMVDLAPTILHLLGEPIPEDMDGRVVAEALQRDYLQARPPQRCSAAGVQDSRSAGLTAQEEQEVVERLQDLGYLS